MAPSSPRSIRLRLTPTPRRRSAYSSASPSVLKQLRSGIDRRTSPRRRAVSRRATGNGSTLKLYSPFAFSASWQPPKRTKSMPDSPTSRTGGDVVHAKRSPPNCERRVEAHPLDGKPLPTRLSTCASFDFARTRSPVTWPACKLSAAIMREFTHDAHWSICRGTGFFRAVDGFNSSLALNTSPCIHSHTFRVSLAPPSRLGGGI